MDEVKRYVYDGPVVAFGRCVSNRWSGETLAANEKKARSNLGYQFKKQNKLEAGARITLPGKIMITS